MPLDITQVRDRAKPLLEKMGGGRLYREAKDRGFPTLSAFLEAEDPSDPAEMRDGLDAFSRLLMVKGVKTNSDRFGAYHADNLERLATPSEPDLFPEWARRQWVAGTSVGQRLNQRAQAQYLSSDFVQGSIQNPYDDDRDLRMQQVEPAIPLAEVIARVRMNNGRDYRARYLTEPTAAQIRMMRVAETAEIPTATLTEGSKTIRLEKFGRGLRASYEALRRGPLDDLALHIRKLALQTEVDQVSAAIDVMVNGDGNSGTSATVYNLTTLDPSASAGTLTLKGWINFRLQWPNPYQVDKIFARSADMLGLLLLNTGAANIMSGSADLGSLRQGFVPMNNRLADGVRYGITTDAPASRIVGIDSRFGVEQVVEQGSDISETMRWISNQTEVLTFSFNEAYAVVDPNAVKILRIDA
jgi:hypothetical protein